MSGSWTVALPLKVPVTKKKPFWLNLNQYRNAHFRTLVKAKNLFRDLVAPRVDHLPAFPKVEITYTYFAPSQQLTDTNNVCSIVDKFFCDILVECGKLTDDNRTIVLSTRSKFGGVDKTNPRVEATLELPCELAGTIHPEGPFNPPSTRQETEVKITIVQTEIEEAVRNHIRSMISVKDGMEITMQFSATRGEDGLIAAIDISPAGAAPQESRPVVQAQPQAEPEAPVQTRRTRSRAELPAESAKDEDMTKEAEKTASSQLFAGGQGNAEHDGEKSDQAEAEPPMSSKPSIFGGLRRPTNETAEAGDAAA